MSMRVEAGLLPTRQADLPSGSMRIRLASVIVLAIVLRCATAVFLGDNVAPISGAADQVSYDALAQRVLDGHGFSFAKHWYPFTEPNQPTAHWSYLYTLYLTGVYAVFGHHPLVARLLQALLSGIGCWLIYRLGRQLFDERVGLVAAALMAAYAYFVFFAAALMTQTFFILALLAALTMAIDAVRAPAPGRWLGLGLVLGIGTLLRQNLLLFAPLLLAWAAWSCRGRMRWPAPLAALLGMALCIAPWTVYNYRVFGDFLLLNSNGGFFLYSSNHPSHGTRFDPNHVAPRPAHVHGLAEPAMDRALAREALAMIRAEPGRFLALSWSRVSEYFRWLPDRRSSLLSNLARLFSFTLYLPFMLWGLLLSYRRWNVLAPLLMYVAFETVMHLSSWAAPRYRLPSDAVMMLFAALAVIDLRERLGSFRDRVARR